MDTEHVIIVMLSTAGAAVTATAIATAYLARQIDEKLSRAEYEDKHQELMATVYKLIGEINNRLHRLEMWAARQGFPNGHK